MHLPFVDDVKAQFSELCASAKDMKVLFCVVVKGEARLAVHAASCIF